MRICPWEELQAVGVQGSRGWNMPVCVLGKQWSCYGCSTGRQSSEVWVREDTSACYSPLNHWPAEKALHLCRAGTACVGLRLRLLFSKSLDTFPPIKRTHTAFPAYQKFAVYTDHPVKKVKEGRPGLCKHSRSSLQCNHQSRKGTPGQSDSLCLQTPSTLIYYQH